MAGITSRIAELSRQEPTDAVMNQIKALDDLRKNMQNCLTPEKIMKNGIRGAPESGVNGRGNSGA